MTVVLHTIKNQLYACLKVRAFSFLKIKITDKTKASEEAFV